ncbi:MAG: DUF192 domain-containing protein [Alphaproteobacteria bacterium]|nr:DUF192 domain-containing protein [Alphaproteobacteria bacterium]
MIGLWLLTTLACGGAELPTTTITLDGTALVVEVADDPEERAQGLMMRDHLAADRGMLFVYPEAQPRSFWMKDTRIPLSIAFLDDKGVIRKIADMTPLSLDHTKSVYPARYAVEVNKGWFAAHGIEVGDRVDGLPTP